MGSYIEGLRAYPEFSSIGDGINIEFQDCENDSLKRIKEKYNLVKHFKGNSDTDKILNLMKCVHDELFFTGEHVQPHAMNTDDIMAVRRTGSLYCSYHATVLSEMLLSLGEKAIIVTCLPCVSDFDCHVAVMVYVKDLKKWAFFDPTFNTCFVNEEGTPLDIFEIREKYMSNEKPLFKHITIDKQWVLVMNNVVYPTYDEWYLAYMSKNTFRFIFPCISAYNYPSREETKYIFVNPINYSEKNDYDEFTNAENIIYTNSNKIVASTSVINKSTCSEGCNHKHCH